MDTVFIRTFNGGGRGLSADAYWQRTKNERVDGRGG